MSTQIDQRIQREIESRLAQHRIPVGVRVVDGVARLTGSVSSIEMHDAVIEIIGSVDGVVEVDSAIEYEVVSPDSVFEAPDDDREFGFADRTSIEDDVSDTDPEFIDSASRTADDERPAFDDSEPYSPPTDPVVGPGKGPGEIRVIGGFQQSSMDELAASREPALDEEYEEPEERVGWDVNREVVDWYTEREDDDIMEDVIRELDEDSLTSGMSLEVSVTDGVVFIRGEVESDDDATNAADVASRVPGVVEVRDRTNVSTD